ncbi:MAG: hypothetical protein KAK02_05195, partial [Desulfobulbaceae bacterium]|nr:hypothetical protein [Desulfobulbaceae bacterium]
MCHAFKSRYVFIFFFVPLCLQLQRLAVTHQSKMIAVFLSSKLLQGAHIREKGLRTVLVLREQADDKGDESPVMAYYQSSIFRAAAIG